MPTCARFASALLLLAAGCVTAPAPVEAPLPAEPGYRRIPPGTAAGPGEELIPEGLDARAFVHRILDIRSRGFRGASTNVAEAAQEWMEVHAEALDGTWPAAPAQADRWRFLRRGSVVFAALLRSADEAFLPATLVLPTAAFQPRPGTAPRVLGHAKGVTGITRDFAAGRLVCELSPDLALKPFSAPAIVLAIEIDPR
jgi:hypothetical protein